MSLNEIAQIGKTGIKLLYMWEDKNKIIHVDTFTASVKVINRFIVSQSTQKNTNLSKDGHRSGV